MGITRATVWSVAAMAAAAVASGAVVCAVRGGLLRIADQEKPAIEAAREPGNPDGAPRTVMVAAVGGEGFANVRGDFARPTPAKLAPIGIAPTVASPAEAPPADGVVQQRPQPMRSWQQQRRACMRLRLRPSSLFAKHHLRRRPRRRQPRTLNHPKRTTRAMSLRRSKAERRGASAASSSSSSATATPRRIFSPANCAAPAGALWPRRTRLYHRRAPHIGVRTSSLKVTASTGWTYKSLQRPDAETAEFWLSGYNAIASAPGETMTSRRRSRNFRHDRDRGRAPARRRHIDVKLDGVVETTYDLASSKAEPVVIRLVPARAATEKVREISITTTGRGPVSIASVAIYNKQTGSPTTALDIRARRRA